MLFFDTEQQIFEQKGGQSVCSNCGHANPARRATLDYLRLVFIPIIPLKRSYSLHCYHCCRSSKTEHTYPSLICFWSVANKFMGLVLISLIVFTYLGWQKLKLEQEFDLLAEPKAFDHYLIDVSRFQNESVHQPRYKVAKVVSRDNTSVSILLGSYEYLK